MKNLTLHESIPTSVEKNIDAKEKNTKAINAVRKLVPNMKCDVTSMIKHIMNIMVKRIFQSTFLYKNRKSTNAIFIPSKLEKRLSKNRKRKIPTIVYINFSTIIFFYISTNTVIKLS